MISGSQPASVTFPLWVALKTRLDAGEDHLARLRGVCVASLGDEMFCKLYSATSLGHQASSGYLLQLLSGMQT